MTKRLLCLVLGMVLSSGAATPQSTDFLHPQQKGPFQVNGLGYIEFPLAGPQSGFVDSVNLGSGYVVPTLDQIISEIHATGTNVVHIVLQTGQVKTYTDNTYDPSFPFPFEGTPGNITAFFRKVAGQGVTCWVSPLSTVANIIEGETPVSSRVQPSDPRAFMAQHIPRLISQAQLAESMGCEYFQLFGDDTEHLVANPDLTDLWLQAIAQIRNVFSGRILAESTFSHAFDLPPGIVQMADIFGFSSLLASTNHADPSVAELASAYQKNADGVNILNAYTSLHTFSGKPLLVADSEFESFQGSNHLGETPLDGQNPASQFTLDYQEQVNGYAAFFQMMPTLDPNWMLGGAFNSFDRLPYAWKDTHLPLYLGSLGESLRGKPALQTVTRAFEATQIATVPANGWWYSPAASGSLYAVEAENGVVRLAILGYSGTGDPQWNLVRCVQTTPGTYVGTAERYTGGQALNQAPAPPTGIVDGPAIKLVFNSATTAILQIGSQNVSIQRYQFSDQWVSPMLNAPKTGWWDQVAQSGRGYFFEVQGNTLFIGGLIYSPSGQPAWFTSTGPVDSSGTFSGSLTVCFVSASSAGVLQAPTCSATTDAIRLIFSAPWRATLTLGRESPVEIRRHRQSEIGWAGPPPSFALQNPSFLGQSATVNAASYTSGVAPGSIAAIFGTGLTRGVDGVVRASSVPLPYSLRGTSVLVNGIPAPIFAIADINGQEQINFQVPWEVQGEPLPPQTALSLIVVTANPVVSIVVVNNGEVSPALRAPFFNVQPAVITTDGTHAVAVHSDYSLVTGQNPARPGDYVTLYGVGFGPVTPLPATGTASGSLPLSKISPSPAIGVGGQNATLQFAGLTPGVVGLYQFNLVMPDGLGVGDLPGLVNIGGQISNVFALPVRGQPSAQSELIQNGSFENPVIGTWIEYVGQGLGAAATFDRTTATVHDGNYSEHVSVTTAGPFYAVGLIQNGIALARGTTYQLQFWVKSSNARHTQIGMTEDGGDFHSYGLGTTVSLSTDWQLYSVAFQATESSSDGRLVLYFGDQTGDVWIDDVSLVAVAPAPSVN